MNRNEYETRKELIDPKLKRAGWTVLTQKGVIEPGKACIEIEVQGMPTANNSCGKGYIDYVLFGDDAKPLAIIEAKKESYSEDKGRAQANLYADCLEHKYGIRPVIYYTNGHNTQISDGIFPIREVFGFHKKDELEHIIQKRKNSITSEHPICHFEPRNDICGRYYQKEAVQQVMLHYNNKHTKSLIVLATGTGKTRVSCAISEIFLRNGFGKRILFLADRKNLVLQAKDDTFNEYLIEPMAIIMEGQFTGSKDARIVFSTYQSMLSIINDPAKCEFGIGHFDLIIIDEAHRSIFNKYAEIFKYFDALMLGLTATPKDEINKSTYQVFELSANNTPNYSYDIQKAVEDGYLTYFRALDRTSDILKNGLTYEELSEEEKEEYENLFTDENGEIPEKIESNKFYSQITNIDTIRQVLRILMDEGIKVDGGDLLGKTIIFAKDHNHADLICNTFKEMYSNLCYINAEGGADYCVIIDNQVDYNIQLQRSFKDDQKIRIVISVDMMDTGVDIPDVVNLVFFKQVQSKVKFWQMIGRGTRLCPELNVFSPHKDYFERKNDSNLFSNYKGKQGFLIFDICNVFPFFKLNPDGKEDRSNLSLTLNQKIFIERVNLLRIMQVRYNNLNHQEQILYRNLKNDLCNEVKNFNREYISIINKSKYIDKYSQLNEWDNIDQIKLTEIKKNIAPCVTVNSQSNHDVFSRNFDLICYKFSSSRFSSTSVFNTCFKSITNIAQYLHDNKQHITEVKNYINDLKYVISDNFCNSDITKINEIRINIGKLVKYIEQEKVENIISDFTDNIESLNDTIDEPNNCHIDINQHRTFEQRISIYIENNKTNDLVKEVISYSKPSNDSIKKFKEEIQKYVQNQEEFNSLFPDDNSIPVFIRKKLGISKDAIDKFIANQQNNSYSSDQKNYIRKLLEYISRNGSFDNSILIQDDFLFGNLFTEAQIHKIISDIKNRL